MYLKYPHEIKQILPRNDSETEDVRIECPNSEIVHLAASSKENSSNLNPIARSEKNSYATSEDLDRHTISERNSYAVSEDLDLNTSSERNSEASEGLHLTTRAKKPKSKSKPSSKSKFKYDPKTGKWIPKPGSRTSSSASASAKNNFLSNDKLKGLRFGGGQLRNKNTKGHLAAGICVILVLVIMGVVTFALYRRKKKQKRLQMQLQQQMFLPNHCHHHLHYGNFHTDHGGSLEDANSTAQRPRDYHGRNVGNAGSGRGKGGVNHAWDEKGKGVLHSEASCGCRRRPRAHTPESTDMHANIRRILEHSHHLDLLQQDDNHPTIHIRQQDLERRERQQKQNEAAHLQGLRVPARVYQHVRKSRIFHQNQFLNRHPGRHMQSSFVKRAKGRWSRVVSSVYSQPSMYIAEEVEDEEVEGRESRNRSKTPPHMKMLGGVD